MSSRTVFLAKLIGLYALVFGISMLANRQGTLTAVSSLLRDPGLVLVSGVFALGVGLAMVLAHNAWSGGALTIVVTLIGWLSTFKGLVLLFLSSADALAGYVQAIQYERLYYLYAAVTLILGAYLTYAGFAASRSINGRAA
jgi:hypothetical protein